MDYTQITNVAALYTLGLIIGGMVFFAAVMTPLVFTKLPPEISGPFIREVFPVFSKVMAGLSLFSAALIWNHPRVYALLVVFFLFIWTWKWLMPKINQFRDEELEGNEKAGKAFNMLHKLSVYINLAQMIIVTVVFLKIAP
jgi:hypothetical protein